jgi:VPDSG-CTERM motif
MPMKNLTKTILGGLAISFISCALFSQQAQAVQITGDIVMGGTLAFNGPLATATQVTHWFAVGTNNDGFSTVFGVTDDLASFISVSDEAAMAQPWDFGSGGPQAGLWSVGGFTFDLASSTIVTQIPGFLNVTGIGTIGGNGFDPTQGQFTLTVTTLGTRFVFGAITNTVPDGGTTVMLLGAAIGALGLARRALKR